MSTQAPAMPVLVWQRSTGRPGSMWEAPCGIHLTTSAATIRTRFGGGILDAFRQPKYSFYLFKSQVRPDITIDHVPTGPFVYIAHEMTPFSPGDVCVVSNCDEVRLRVLGEEVGTKSTVQPGYVGMPHEPVVFENAFRFLDVKELSRAGNGALVIMEAEGLIDGVVVARAVKYPALPYQRLKMCSSGIICT